MFEVYLLQNKQIVQEAMEGDYSNPDQIARILAFLEGALLVNDS
jgi:hypothetical protein